MKSEGGLSQYFLLVGGGGGITASQKFLVTCVDISSILGTKNQFYLDRFNWTG